METWLKILGSSGNPVADAWAYEEHGPHRRTLDQSVMFAKRPSAKPGDRIVYLQHGDSEGVRRG